MLLNKALTASKTASDKWESFDVLKLSRIKYKPLKENQ